MWQDLGGTQSGRERYIGDPAGDFQNRHLAEIDPSLVLTGSRPHLIDEWQEVPGIWDAVRLSVDRSRQKGRYLLTGSSTPTRKGVMHSGVGRIGILPMRPMSLFESGDSSGVVSLRSLFEAPLSAVSCGEVSLHRIAELVVRGGWPDGLDTTLDTARELARSYLDRMVEDDAIRIDDVRRDSHKLRLLLRSLARNESTLATNSTLIQDMLEFESETLAPRYCGGLPRSLAKALCRLGAGRFQPRPSSVRSRGEEAKAAPRRSLAIRCCAWHGAT